MKLSELMSGVTPNPEFAGIVTAGDMVLAVDFSGEAASPADYIVADEGVTEQTGTLEATTADSTYLRSGTSTTKTGTTRSFTVAGDRFAGDEFQHALLDLATPDHSAQRGRLNQQPALHGCVGGHQADHFAVHKSLYRVQLFGAFGGKGRRPGQPRFDGSAGCFTLHQLAPGRGNGQKRHLSLAPDPPMGKPAAPVIPNKGHAPAFRVFLGKL